MKPIQTYKEMATTAITSPERVPPYIRRRVEVASQGPRRRRETERAIKGKPRQKDRLDDLREEEEYLLIVLDACRYDYFVHTLAQHVRGRVGAVASEGHDTFEYVRKCWPREYPETTYVSGAVPVTSDEMFEFSDTDLQELYEGYVPRNHIGEIVDVWDFGWAPALGTCPPEAVLAETLDRLDESELVAHFFQPHAPYIGEIQELGHSNDGSATPGDGEPVDAPVWRRVRDGHMSDERLKEAYQSNLQRAARSVWRLITELRERGDDRRIVIMGDHGEALGEYGVYSHPRTPHPKIRVVPWVEVEHITDDARERGAHVDVEKSTGGEGDATERLKSLGYI